MHLVRHREVVEELSEVPPAMPDTFVPDARAARQIVTAAIADGRKWLEPVEIKHLLEAYDIAMVPTYAAGDVEQAVARANEVFAQGATVVLKIMSPKWSVLLCSILRALALRRQVTRRCGRLRKTGIIR